MNSKKFSLDGKYIKLGLTVFLSGGALILAFFILNNFGDVKKFLSDINSILMPFYLGIVMAYLLCPIYNGSLKFIYSTNRGRFRKHVRDYKFARFFATVTALVVLMLALGGLFMLVIPDLITSIISLIKNLPDIAERLSAWIQAHVEQNPQLIELLQGSIETYTDKIFSWAQTKVLPGAEAVLTGVSMGVIGTIGSVIDIFVALVICVYVLNSKEIFKAQAKKFILAVFSNQKAKDIFEFGRICDDTFGGFINGKIIDSIIIGILCFASMTALKLPLAMLISVVVGVTNIIPFFGPFIGAVPSIILLLCIEPWSAVKFGILILVLQQLDGNIIGPKILGKATKLSSFWVMFAIIVGGGLFGFIGMILGVPTMAVIYVYITRLVNKKLAAKNLPVGTEVYEDFSKYNINKEDIFGKDSCVQFTEITEIETESADELPR